MASRTRTYKTLNCLKHLAQDKFLVLGYKENVIGFYTYYIPKRDNFSYLSWKVKHFKSTENWNALLEWNITQTDL